jgi:predicted amidophosphoribosyltransferase
MLATWLGELLGDRCLACGATGASLCGLCAASLRRSSQGALPPGIASVTAPWAYEGPARALILALKLRGLRMAARPLIEGMTDATRPLGVGGETLTWVPGRPKDIRARGFDHAELLGRGLARELGLRPQPLLRRRHPARDQASLSALDRAENVRGAFGAVPSPPCVVLVDDLMTTGATAAACAAALKAAGAERIQVVTACRA